MQTNLADFVKNTPQGIEADSILRTCVHCGFCNATCPTYQLLGDELDGPRGRIYLIKQMLEGQQVTHKTRDHLDRCLTCVNCQTTCPSGVRYGRLVDIGREIAEERTQRPFADRLMRRMLRWILPYPARFGPLLGLGRAFRFLMPARLRNKIPERANISAQWPQQQHARTMLLLDGCVQPALAPGINAATAKVLDQCGISIVRATGAGCCGAVSQHLAAPEEARRFMRHNIDAWWPHIEAGAEAIVMTASGCGSLVKEYEHHLQGDPAYSDKARRISELTKDLSEVIRDEDLPRTGGSGKRIAFHPPCTLQHGQKVIGVVEQILLDAGYELTAVNDAHLCCGSAGTYSILQPELSQQLLSNKLGNLQAGQPELVATANIGCLTHLQTKSDVPVVHWIELLSNA